ncbi:MAG: PCP reductase family protein [Cyanobacteria bacterium J06642_2]
MSDWNEPLQWTAAALEKLRSIPFFARSQARQYIEQLARDRDLDAITPEFVDEARKTFGS